MNTQRVIKNLTGLKAEISGIKIIDVDNQIHDTIVNSINDLELIDVARGEKEAKFHIEIESNEVDFLIKGRLNLFQKYRNCVCVKSLYEFDITAIKNGEPVYFSINGQTQYDFRDNIEREIEQNY